MKLKDIAEICGVSIATVSKVVNGKTSDIGDATIKRIEAVLEENNYIPNGLARSMKTNRSHSLGLIIPDVRNPFFTEISRGAEDIAYKNGYTLFFSNTDDSFEKEKNYLFSHLERRVDGILIIGAHERNEQVEKSLKLNVPIVSIDRPVYYNSVISEISTDNYYGASLVADYLIELGHNKVLYIGGSPKNITNVNRRTGFIDTIKNSNKDIKVDIQEGSFTYEYGYNSIINTDNLNYDAIFCANDMIAFGVLKALDEKNIRIPEDMSVVGFDDITFASISNPSLTTVRQPSYELGQLGAKTLIDYIENNRVLKKKYELDQNLVIRSSTSHSST